MAPQKSYDWKRFWCPRDGSINLIDSGYLADPDGPYGSYLNPALPPFEEISRLPCLALLGEPGIGKTSTMRAESGAIDAAVLAEGGRTLWLDLRAGREPEDGRLVAERFARHLQDLGTREACLQLARVMVELPDVEDKLKWTLYQAKAETRRRTWVAPEPRHVLDLVAKRGSRLVQNGDQVLGVVTESLRRLEAELQGETPAAPDLWNQRDDGTHRPKDEEAFSDHVKRHLRQDLEGRGVIVNREVVIRRGEGRGQGERTDVHVDAVLQDSGAEERATVTVIIEAKGCWYYQLYKAMETQLAGRYLKDNRCRHGLYLVGWFNCPQWDPEDSRHKVAAKRDRTEAGRKLEGRAAALSEGGVRVRAMTLNTTLR